MRVFLAGATGAIGRPLVARLIEAGHEVVGTTRSPDRAERLRAAGAEPALLDAFDTAALREALLAARPEVVLHQLTALSAPLNPRRYGEWIADTNRLRREVTPALVAAAREAGARRIVAQSIAFIASPEGPAVLDETASLYTAAPDPIGEAVRAAAALEAVEVEADGIEGLVLRCGYFYGPGTSYGPGGDIVEQMRARRFPLIGSAAGCWSFVHVDDAAAATALALDAGAPGVYNIVDDEPARSDEWLPELARVLGARRPMRVPAFVARVAAGHFAVHYATAQRGASNAKARRELGWAPARSSWREGFRETLGTGAARGAAQTTRP